MQDTLEIRDFLSERQSHATLGRYLCEGFVSSGKMYITHPLSPESISIESKERNLPVSKHFGNSKAFSSKRGLWGFFWYHCLRLCGCPIIKPTLISGKSEKYMRPKWWWEPCITLPIFQQRNNPYPPPQSLLSRKPSSRAGSSQGIKDAVHIWKHFRLSHLERAHSN